MYRLAQQDCLKADLHRQDRPPGRLPRFTKDRESRLMIGRDRTRIVRVRICCDNRDSCGKHPSKMLRDKGRAVPTPDHIWLTNELVDAPRSRRKGIERVILPTVNSVILDICKRAFCKRNDPSSDSCVFQFFVRAWLIGIPPFANMRVRLPFRDHSKIFRRHLAKSISVLGKHGQG